MTSTGGILGFFFTF